MPQGPTNRGMAGRRQSRATDDAFKFSKSLGHIGHDRIDRNLAGEVAKFHKKSVLSDRVAAPSARREPEDGLGLIEVASLPTVLLGMSQSPAH
jgi:hypothetical protein